MNTRKNILTVMAAFSLTGLMAPGLFAAEESETPVQSSIAVPNNTSESGLADLARIPASEAITRASAGQPGKVLSVKLENEDGFAVWAVELAAPTGRATEVLVDAGNGAVLKLQNEKTNEENGEEQEENEGSGGDQD